MPNEKKTKSKCVEYLRHTEYYDMQNTFDELYARSQAGEIFDGLMDVILSRENILLAYRNIKSNIGSFTPGTDKLKISDIGKLTADEVTARVCKIVKGGKNGYTPRSVRRKEIPKPNGSTRPLGIPCIWDRLIQQCIKQVMEPICEARFSNNSYGFRPNRSVENAIAAIYRLMQRSGLYYVVEFDVKGFFDNVDHSKLIKQLWSLNIRDKELLYVIRRILKAPILMPDGHTEHPTKGTPQGGIISPLLANVVLNELDHWIESQWQCNPVTENYSHRENAAGCPIQSHAYRAMRNTRLKEMYIVRYADDFRILCRTKEQADRTLIAVTHWLKERLRLDVSPEKTRVVDTRRSYSEFLGFKIRLRKKGKKYVVQSHMCDKAYKKVKTNLTKQVGNIKFPRKNRGEAGEVRLFNSMVMGIQNYYQLATDISIDCGDIGGAVNTVLKNRLKSGKTHRLKEEGRDLTKMELQRYGKSEQLKYIAQSKEPIYPISYVQCKNPMSQRRKVCAYTAAGRSEIHDDLRINTFLLLQLMRAPTYSRSTEYADNRISLFSAQWGKCAVTGKEFQCVSEIHCHHKKPKGIGGSDKYENLVLVLAPVHELIHAADEDTIRSYLSALKLDAPQLTKLNKLRILANRKPIDLENLKSINSHNGMTKETKKTV
jgi:RNA-directed DNA polymerase